MMVSSNPSLPALLPQYGDFFSQLPEDIVVNALGRFFTRTDAASVAQLSKTVSASARRLFSVNNDLVNHLLKRAGPDYEFSNLSPDQQTYLEGARQCVRSLDLYISSKALKRVLAFFPHVERLSTDGYSDELTALFPFAGQLQSLTLLSSAPQSTDALLLFLLEAHKLSNFGAMGSSFAEVLPALEPLAHMHTLSVYSPNHEEAFFTQVAMKVPNLRALSLENARTYTLAPLSRSQHLRELTLRDCLFSDRLMKDIKGLAHLTSLSLSEYALTRTDEPKGMTNEGLLQLQNLPLKKFELRFFSSCGPAGYRLPTKEAFTQLFQSLPNLEEHTLHGVSAASCEGLVQCSKLRKLSLALHRDEDSSFLSQLPALEELTYEGTLRVAHIQELQHLHTLTVRRRLLVETTERHLTALKKVHYTDYNQDETMENNFANFLVCCPNLEHLSVSFYGNLIDPLWINQLPSSLCTLSLGLGHYWILSEKALTLLCAKKLPNLHKLTLEVKDIGVRHKLLLKNSFPGTLITITVKGKSEIL